MFLNIIFDFLSCQANLLYFIFVGLFWLCSWVCMYMCIFHYFNYYLPDFVTAISLGFIFGFSFLGICFNLTFGTSENSTTNHLWNFYSWPEIKPWAFGRGALTPRPWINKELTSGSIKSWELTHRKPLEYKTWHHPTISSTLCRMPPLNNKQNKNTNPIISRQDYHLTHPCPSEENQMNKHSTQISPYIKLTQTTGPNLVSQFRCSGVSNSLWLHGLQHARLPHPSPIPGVYSNSCPLSQWCHPTISSSVIHFSSYLRPFPASGSFQMSQFFASGGQSIGVSALASVLPMNIQDWFPLGGTGRASLQSKAPSRVFPNSTVQKHQFFSAQLSLQSNSHIHTWLLEKTIALTRWIFVGKVMSLHFNMLSGLSIAFFSRSRHF